MKLSLGSQLNNYGSDSTCWSFSKDDQVPFPIIQGIIANTKTNNTLTIELKVDTGFNGVLGLAESAIKELQLTAGGHSMVRSATGEKRLEYYEVNLSIPKTPFWNMKAIAFKTPRPIIGRMLLNFGSWLYDGKNNNWCLL